MSQFFQPDLSYIVTQWLFLKLLGVIYLLAFGSLLVQVEGLYGSQGVLPIQEFLALLRNRLGKKRYFHYPSLFWLHCNDRFLRLCAAAGPVLALLLIAGFYPPICLALLWLLYLSFVTVGREFLAYQWDALLLEAGFMSIFFALVSPPTLLMIFCYCFFLFRFLFSAGAVKLTSGDPHWRKLLALCYHYQTQPLPNRIGWYAHHLPASLQKLSTLGTFFFELLVPFFLLVPGQGRLVAVLLTLLFQSLILSTGNYGFFNLLTMVLAIPLVEDQYLVFLSGLLPEPEVAAVAPALIPVVSLMCMVFLVLNALQLIALFYRPLRLGGILPFLAPLWLSNSYGLFAVMTTRRLEFVIEGSHDLKEWRSYGFRWKPGDLQSAPKQVAPHQPRLDWQMWFAALDPVNPEAWLWSLLQKLLRNSPAVVSLLKTNPFPEAPPRYIRLALYRYNFTDLATRRRTGKWWERTALGTSPAMTREE